MIRLLSFEVIHARLHRRLVHAILDGGNNPGDSLFNLREIFPVGCRLRTSVMIQPVHLLGSLGHRMRRDKFVLDAGQNPRLDLLTGDGPTIVSGAPPVMVEAGIAARRDDAELAAAASAGEKAGQERNRLAHNCPVDVL